MTMTDTPQGPVAGFIFTYADKESGNLDSFSPAKIAKAGVLIKTILPVKPVGRFLVYLLPNHNSVKQFRDEAAAASSPFHPCPALLWHKVSDVYLDSFRDLASTDGPDGEISRLSPSGHLFFIEREIFAPVTAALPPDSQEFFRQAFDRRDEKNDYILELILDRFGVLKITRLSFFEAYPDFDRKKNQRGKT